MSLLSMHSYNTQWIVISFRTTVIVNDEEEEREKRKCTCMQLREVIIAIKTIKTVFKLKDVLPLGITVRDQDLVPNDNYSLLEVSPYVKCLE